MISVLRFCAALAAAALCIPAAGWLTLICADFIGFDDCLSPRPGWVMFSVVSTCALALPPALHMWPDTSRAPKELLREGLRAVLLAFALFAVIFLAGARPFFAWLAVPAPMTAVAASSLAPLFACPLAYASYRIARALVPIPAPEAPAPRPMRFFGRLSLILAALIIFHPWLTGGTPLLFVSRLGLFGAAWLILALRHVLLVHGEMGFIPLWGGFCMFCAFQLGTALPYLNVVELSLSSMLVLVAAGSCFCLLHSENRRWFR